MSPPASGRLKKPTKPRFILDSSALLTMIKEAPGGSVVGAQLRQSAISAVNWSDVLSSVHSQGIDVEGMRRDLEVVGLKIFPFTVDDAELAASFESSFSNLDLCDRACLALATRLGLPVLTAEIHWQKLSLDVDLQMVR